MSSYAASYLPQHLSRFSSSFISQEMRCFSSSPPMLRRRVLQRDRRDRDAQENTDEDQSQFQDVLMAFKSFCFSALSTRKTRTSSTHEWRHRCRLHASSRLAPLVAERPFFFLRETAEGVFSTIFLLELDHPQKEIASKKKFRHGEGPARITMPPFHAHHRCLTVSSFLSPLMMLPSLRDGSGRCAKRASPTRRRHYRG